MSVMNKTPEQLASLTATLKSQPHIQQVYFDKRGRHFFHAHEHEGKRYSRVDLERVVTGYRGQETVVKTVGKAKAENELVEAVPREQVLSLETDMKTDSKKSVK